MGTWGVGVFEDDFAMDLRDGFEQAMAEGATPLVAAARVVGEWGEETLEDPDDGPIFALALATLLREHGVRSHPLIDRARRVVECGEGLELWEEAGEATLAQRRAVYAQLQEQLA
jgi:hypothetical protein